MDSVVLGLFSLLCSIIVTLVICNYYESRIMQFMIKFAEIYDECNKDNKSNKN